MAESAIRKLVDDMCDGMADQTFLLVDGFDDAILGLDISGSRVVYSVRKCVEVLMKRDGMNEEEAEEFFEFNVRGSIAGDETPVWCDDEFLADDNDNEMKALANEPSADDPETSEKSQR